jgi:hypothetical protein
MSSARRARLHSDLGDVGHHTLDGRVGLRDQLLYVVDLGLSLAQRYRPGHPRDVRLASSPSMALTVCSLSADVAAEPGVSARPRGEYPRAPGTAADRLRHSPANVRLQVVFANQFMCLCGFAPPLFGVRAARAVVSGFQTPFLASGRLRRRRDRRPGRKLGRATATNRSRGTGARSLRVR